MTPDDETTLPTLRLEMLRQAHRDLDLTIKLAHKQAQTDELALCRLKKRKLAIKDQIAQLERQLTPDDYA
jgi:hypothetical protein